MRGDVHRLRAPQNARGKERSGARYAVVVQSDDLPLSTLFVAPTPTSARAASFRPEINIKGRRARVLAEQTAAPRHLHLSQDLIAAIETFIDAWNERCRPFTWTKTADDILAKASQGQRTSFARH